MSQERRLTRPCCDAGTWEAASIFYIFLLHTFFFPLVSPESLCSTLPSNIYIVSLPKYASGKGLSGSIREMQTLRSSVTNYSLPDARICWSEINRGDILPEVNNAISYGVRSSSPFVSVFAPCSVLRFRRDETRCNDVELFLFRALRPPCAITSTARRSLPSDSGM